jgi:hypothetical protein
VRGEADAVAKSSSVGHEVYAKSNDTGRWRILHRHGAADIALSLHDQKCDDITARYADGADGSNDLANDMADALDNSLQRRPGGGNPFK